MSNESERAAFEPTLEKVRNRLLSMFSMDDDETPMRIEYKELADACAQLIAEQAKAEAVGEVFEEDIRIGFGRPAKSLTIRWFTNDRPPFGSKLYLHPAPSTERVAAQGGDDVTTYEVWQDGFCQAGANNLDDAKHYFAMYSQDGDCELRQVTSRSKIIALRATPADGDGHG